MTRTTIVVVLAAMVLFSVSGSGAFAQSGELRTIPLVVMSPEGKLVNGISAENVHVEGRAARVQSMELESGSRHITLLLDISGSMKSWAVYGGRERWRYAKEMAKAFLDYASPQDFVALDVFAKTETQSVPFTHDFASIRRAIDALPEPDSKEALGKWGEDTFAGDALHAAMLEMGQQSAFGDAVVFFSDAGFQKGNLSPYSLNGDLQRRGVRVFLALPFTSQLQAGRGPYAYGAFTQDIPDASTLVEDSGGFSFAPAIFLDNLPLLQVHLYRSDPLQKRMMALYDAVQGTYRVGLQLDKPLRKKHGLELEVIDRQGKTLHDLLLFYPRDLYPN
jgi:hypothetical protein